MWTCSAGFIGNQGGGGESAVYHSGSGSGFDVGDDPTSIVLGASDHAHTGIRVGLVRGKAGRRRGRNAGTEQGGIWAVGGDTDIFDGVFCALETDDVYGSWCADFRRHSLFIWEIPQGDDRW